MKLRRLIHKGDPFYRSFRSLYEISFPLYEQRTEEQQQQAFDSMRYRLDVYLDDDRLIGFVSYWVWADYFYIEHLAVCPQMRAKGYGCRILTELNVRGKRRLLLEIDPIKDDISAARLRFYERAGFVQNPVVHVHPPYREGADGHSLIVLTTDRLLSVAEYDRFRLDLTTVVMAF